MKSATIRKEFYTRLSIFCLVIFLLTVPIPGFAQEPPGQEPGTQAERYKEDVKRERQQLEHKERKRPEIKVEEEKPGFPATGPSFILKEVKVTGSTVFKLQDFQPIYQSHLNRKVAFQEMQELSGKIESKYKEKGYFTTTVYIPEQDIKNGVIEIRIAEGKMGRLDVEGSKWFSADFIKKFFHAKKNEILNVKTMARDILRLNKNPDLEVKALISPGKDPQTSDISLKVEGRQPWHTGFLQDNRGSRLTGKYRSMVFIRSSNVSGLGDMLFFNSLYTGNSLGESISYSIPIGTYGTKFSLDATYFKMKLGKEYKPFDITGNTQIYTPYFSWELALSEVFEAYANLGMDIKSIKKKMAGDVTANDQLRTPYFSFDFSKTDPTGQTTFSPKFNFGTAGFLGASHRNHPTSSRAGTGGFFFKYEQSLNRMQKMFFNSYLSIRTRLQAASHTLASSEQFQLGGADSVRGYPEGDYLADSAAVANFDWVFPMYLIPKSWKLKGEEIPLRHQLEPVFFVDIGGGDLKKVLPGEKREKFLAGVGGGLRLRFKLFSLRLDWAKAIADKPASGSGPSTFYFTFQSEL